jgi:hypothetical protein
MKDASELMKEASELIRDVENSNILAELEVNLDDDFEREDDAENIEEEMSVEIMPKPKSPSVLESVRKGIEEVRQTLISVATELNDLTPEETSLQNK